MQFEFKEEDLEWDHPQHPLNVASVRRFHVLVPSGKWELYESVDGGLCLRLVDSPNAAISIEPLSANHFKVRVRS